MKSYRYAIAGLFGLLAATTAQAEESADFKTLCGNQDIVVDSERINQDLTAQQLLDDGYTEFPGNDFVRHRFSHPQNEGVYTEQTLSGAWQQTWDFTSYPQCVQDAPQNWLDAFAVIEQTDAAPLLRNYIPYFTNKDSAEDPAAPVSGPLYFSTGLMHIGINPEASVPEIVVGLIDNLKRYERYYAIKQEISFDTIFALLDEGQYGCSEYATFFGPSREAEIYTVALLTDMIANNLIKLQDYEPALDNAYVGRIGADGKTASVTFTEAVTALLTDPAGLPQGGFPALHQKAVRMLTGADSVRESMDCNPDVLKP